MAENIFFSVIIPTFNRKSFLERAVDSVLSQTWKDLELIVTDDGSTDDTGSFMETVRDDRVRYLKLPHLGVSSARNSGIRAASGDNLAFLDSDDYWVPEKLERTAWYMSRFPEISIFHTEETWLRRGKILSQKKKHAKPEGRVFRQALPLCCIGMSTAVVKRKVFNAIGLFDETFEACEDYDLWLRAANLYDVKLIPEPLTVKNGGRPDQLSVKTWGLDRFRIKALEKMLMSGELTKEDRAATLTELSLKCGIFALGCEKRSRSSEAEYYRGLPLSYLR